MFLAIKWMFGLMLPNTRSYAQRTVGVQSLSRVWLLWLHELWLARFFWPWDFPGKNAGVGFQFPSPGDLPNPGIEPRSPAFRQILYRLNHQGSSSTHSEAQQIKTLGFVQRNIYLRAEQEGMAHVQKTLNFLKNFGKAFLKARWGRDVPEYVISWCTVLWLMLRWQVVNINP